MESVTTPGPIVTIYAQHSVLIEQIAEKVRDRGASTHTVSVDTGWVSSVSRAIMVLDCPAGMSALRALCDADPYGARVVALLTEHSEVEAQDLCDRCIERHDLVVLRTRDDGTVDRVVDEVMSAA
jgi:hypothetical protein